MDEQLMITKDDKSALLLILILFLLVVSTLSVFSQVTIRYALTKAVAINDWVAIVAMVLGLLQSICVSVATRRGLGVQESKLNTQQIAQTAKAQYSADMFYWFILGSCKLSILLFIARLSTSKTHKLLARYTMYFVGIWTLTATLTLALQCGDHIPWASRNVTQCINLDLYWKVASVFDLLPEVATIVLPIVMVWPVQLPTKKKILVASVFTVRIIYCAAVIVRLFFLPVPLNAKNFTFLNINSTIATQAMLCSAITTACLPALKPVLEAFNSGGMSLHIRQDHDYYGSDKYRSTRESRGFSSQQLDRVSKRQSHRLNFLKPACLEDIPSLSSLGNRDISDSGESSIRKPSQQEIEDRISTSSAAPSDEMIIKKDTIWSVSYETNYHVTVK